MDYVERKIAHMRRIGEVMGSSSGKGRNGGACPDWLRERQEEEDKRSVKK